MGNRETKAQKQVRTQTARIAARWWRKLLEDAKPQTKAGMSSFAQNFITDQHNRMKAQTAPEQVEAFEKNLAALLEKQLGAKEGLGIMLHVDYDPLEPLAAIMRDNRIPQRIFPPHTWMHVERGRIEVTMDGKEPTELPLSAD